MPYVEVNGLDLYYEEFGRGETVLFLHSHFSRGLLAFSGQILPFSGHFRCLFPDFRGHGRTKCDDLSWNSRMVADDMAMFLEKLGIEKAHIIGYSCGAYVGCYMAAKYPQKVRSLVTIGGAAHPRPEGAEDFLPENLLKNGSTDFIEDIKARHMDAHKGDWQTYLRNTVEDWKTQPGLTDEEWHKITCPAFFINGENDPFGTVEELKEKVPYARTYKVIGGGHRPHFVGEQIDDINKRILDFLSGI
ncbi:MAG: alpha/beta hydrolase [Clostridiales bacterium]|nr:alpha/beta hydrolase [Clostridiales bacterium]